MTVKGTGLPHELHKAVREVRIAPDLESASFADRTLAADNVNELQGRLASALYESWHAGHILEGRLNPEAMVDSDLSDELEGAIPFQTTRASARLVRRVEDAREAWVRIDGVVVRLPGDRVPESVTEGQRFKVEIDAARPNLSPGYFLVDGSSGTVQPGHTLRVYVHIASHTAAPRVWRAALEELEAAGCGYRAKVSATPHYFPRYDSLVVYLGPDAWHTVGALGKAVQGIPGIGVETSLYARQIAPGIAVAWEPDDPRPGRMDQSYGEHRSVSIAEAILEHATDDTSADRAEVVKRVLREANVDPSDLSRNLTSPNLQADA